MTGDQLIKIDDNLQFVEGVLSLSFTALADGGWDGIEDKSSVLSIMVEAETRLKTARKDLGDFYRTDNKS